ncbi:coagulation factor X isoform X1 [Procambarus clarkii]|uniref:coagulation factor X isoform X1 n=1 Tax=Procambarus clarkii TaxID=6728 RepID=UPI001E673FA6|nr:coagulation factor X-like isoform X1 [Procambarus clarkii]XP_045618725.1 coagulation factor X-like isoform X1 [Procambarus clarkii]XP_045618726.1 coagulation factor X-like isoform X1 [Procambarus clarkii]XP_045618727.1 coagulation factor X-like isoform X1 [Procambarus clarkii]
MLGKWDWWLLGTVLLGFVLEAYSQRPAEGRSKRQDGISFSIPVLDNGGNRRQRQDNNPIASAIGSFINTFIRPPHNPSPNGQPSRPGNSEVGNLNIGGLPVTVTSGQNGIGISFGQNAAAAGAGGGCRLDNGGCEQVCRHTRRGIRCFCDPGYFLNPDRQTCSDLDECRFNNGGCSDLCSNTLGSFTCSCAQGNLQPDQRTCFDGGNTCAINNGGCSEICLESEEGVRCLCHPGSTVGRDGQCLQLDLCLNNNGGCEETCSSTQQGAVCSCGPGKTLATDGRSCKVLDKCSLNNGGCQQICDNTPGAFHCKCVGGFLLLDDGRCQAIIQTTPRTTTSTTTTSTTTSTTTTSTTTTTTKPSTGGEEPRPTRGCGINTKKSLFNRIVGGKPADPKDWPWMAALLKSSTNTQYCGGTLVTDRHILTAAHCLKPFTAKDIRVRLGEYTFDQTVTSDAIDFGVTEFRMHERYDSKTQENDIALVKLDKPATFSETIWPVCLPPPQTSYQGRDGYVTGWGTIYYGGPVSPTLQEVVVPIWSKQDCSSAYPSKILPGMMCAGSKTGGMDSCQGDSGGPFQVQDFRSRRWYVAGVVSWGERCALPEKPGVYTEVALFVDWIKSNAIF